MITLSFNGPFLFEDLVKQKDAYDHGIYIWGFKYPNTGKFIPYYVGKSLSNIVGRIAQHKKDILKPKSTYARLSYEFMENFYMCNELHRLIKPDKNSATEPAWFEKDFKDKVDYLNAKWFIPKEKLQDNSSKKDYPISLINPKKDFLKDNIDNVYICYAVPTIPVNIPISNDLFEHLETITKINLKGYTLGKKEKGDKTNEFIYNNKKIVVEIDFIEELKYLKKTGASDEPIKY